jgi:hypothetical protein
MYGAKEDTISFTDETGSKTETFASGQSSKTVSITILPTGNNITFTSTGSKDPSDLSSNYTKTITVTSGTTEVYVMPDNALYWYGYESDDCEELNSANGWSNAATAITWITPTRQTRYIDMTVDAINKGVGLGSKNAISSLSTLKCIMDNNISTDQLLIRTCASKSYSNAVTTDFNTNPTGLQIRTVADTYGSNRYGCAMCWGLKNSMHTVKLYALWYE